MVGKITFEITGAKEMEKALREFGPQVASRLGDRALRAAARPIVKEAKRLAPKQTGALRRSITAVKGKSSSGLREVLIGFKPPVSRRAHFTEYGTSKSAPHPFIRPALDSQSAEALKAMAEDMAKGIAQQEYKRALAAGVDFSEFESGD